MAGGSGRGGGGFYPHGWVALVDPLRRTRQILRDFPAERRLDGRLADRDPAQTRADVRPFRSGAGPGADVAGLGPGADVGSHQPRISASGNVHETV